MGLCKNALKFAKQSMRESSVQLFDIQYYNIKKYFQKSPQHIYFPFLPNIDTLAGQLVYYLLFIWYLKFSCKKYTLFLNI